MMDWRKKKNIAARRSLAQVINIYFVPTHLCVTTPQYYYFRNCRALVEERFAA